MRVIEHAVDVWDLRGMDARLNSKELVWMEPQAELADHEGPCHVSVFKRVLEPQSAAP